MTAVVIFRGLSSRRFSFGDAKASLSAVVDEAIRDEEWERLSAVPSFGRLLMAAPLTADDVPNRDNSSLWKSEL